MLKLPKILNCRAAAEMSCRRRDGQLSHWDRMTLAVHLIICAGCRLMDRQFALLDKAARQLAFRNAGTKTSENGALSPQSRERLKKLIR